MGGGQSSKSAGSSFIPFSNFPELLSKLRYNPYALNMWMPTWACGPKVSERLTLALMPQGNSLTMRNGWEDGGIELPQPGHQSLCCLFYTYTLSFLPSSLLFIIYLLICLFLARSYFQCTGISAQGPCVLEFKLRPLVGKTCDQSFELPPLCLFSLSPPLSLLLIQESSFHIYMFISFNSTHLVLSCHSLVSSLSSVIRVQRFVSTVHCPFLELS